MIEEVSLDCNGAQKQTGIGDLNIIKFFFSLSCLCSFLDTCFLLFLSAYFVPWLFHAMSQNIQLGQLKMYVSNKLENYESSASLSPDFIF